MSINKNPSCIFCDSSKVIKHGKTSNGNSRFRCRMCGKTWAPEKSETFRPEITDIVESYLSGRTYRDLVPIYHSSPLRINQKIRKFLNRYPNWEEYLDSYINIHEPRLIYLIGKEFSCASKDSINNKMYLAIAFDAMSSVVLGFQIASNDSYEVWFKLLDRLNKRGFLCQAFMANGSEAIESAVETVFPSSPLRISYRKTYRDNELLCCLSRLAVNNKLIADSIKSYESLRNENLSKYLRAVDEQQHKDILTTSPEIFINRLKERMNQRSRTRAEGLLNAFQTRFEKFHMLKDDPFPVVNGWIGRRMVQKLDFGFSRLSLYSQIPSSVSFMDFSTGVLPTALRLQKDSPLLRSFVIEISVRGLQLPIFCFRCEMKLDNCSLF